MVKKVTDRMVAGLALPKSGTRVVYDGTLGGFGVRITANGSRSFVLDYANAHGQHRRHTIGKWPEFTAEGARVEAEELRAQIRKGGDPVEDRREQREKVLTAPKVKDLGDRYYNEYVLVMNREDQHRNVRDILNKIIYPRWEKKKADGLTTADVRALHQSMKKTKYRANRVLSTISKMCTWGMEKGLCSQNPAKGVKKYNEDKRATWLDADQMERLDGAITDYGAESAELIRLLLLTGFRQREWMRARKPDFDMRHAIWTKPSHSVKENKTEQVPLGAATMTVLRRVMASAPNCEWLFPGKKQVGKDGKPAMQKYRTTIRRPWEQVLRTAGLAEERPVISKNTGCPVVSKRTGEPMKAYRMKCRLHDLRHTYISWLADRGVPLAKIGKLVGHQRPETTDRYNHIADKALREATDMFGDMLTQRVQ